MATVAENIAGGADLGPKKVVPIVDEPASDVEHESAPWATGDFGNKLATPEKAEGEARAQHLEAAPASVSVVSDDEGAAAAPKPHIRGVKTFGDKYLPFAAGFENMVNTAPVYRSARLHAINPTAALSDDVSYLYTLDSGVVTPAAAAADPNYDAEFVRNTLAESRGGLINALKKPIR